MQDRPFKVGNTVELTIRVRGPLINVDVNGKHAARLPVADSTRPGSIELITFAATADFKAFELASLPSDYKLVAAKPAKGSTASPTTPEDARRLLAIAEKELQVAEAEPRAIRTRFAAERAKYKKVQRRLGARHGRRKGREGDRSPQSRGGACESGARTRECRHGTKGRRPEEVRRRQGGRRYREKGVGTPRRPIHHSRVVHSRPKKTTSKRSRR